jgi:hypothetical protein
MHPPMSKPERIDRIAASLTIGLALFLSSCGTLLYPERRGQPAGRLDIGVVALDGVGLLVFLVPGVIAFVVGYAMAAPSAGTELRQVRVDPAELTPRRVEAVVQEQTGKTVSLQPGAYRAMRLQKLDDFTPAALAELEANSNADRVIFRASGE